MHSSRMRTARLLPVSPSMHCSRRVPGPGVYLVPGGVPGPRGGVPDPGVGGVYLPRGDVPAWEGCTCPGEYLPGGGTCPATPAPVNRMTNRCKNITLPQTSFVGGKNSSIDSVLRD